MVETAKIIPANASSGSDAKPVLKQFYKYINNWYITFLN